MGDVYSVIFDAAPPETGDTVQRLRDSLREWIGDRWTGEHEWFEATRPATVKTADGSIFRWEPFEHESSALHEFTWRHPDRSHPTVTWSTQLSVIDVGGSLRFSLRVSNSGPEFPDPLALLTTRPRLVHALASRFGLRQRTLRLKTKARRLNAQTLPDFARYELFDPARELPLIVLSPTEDGRYLVEPDRLAGEFLSLAEVCAVADAASTFELTRLVGSKELSCFHGALRAYMPGLTKHASPQHHPLLLSGRVDDKRQRLRLAHFLAALTVRHFRGEPRIQALRDERAVVADAKRVFLEQSLDDLRRGDADATEWVQ